jgi:sec-independent protein translocase protein TatB
MFGINFGEFLLLLLIALAVFGPDRLPEVARQAGRFMRTARAMLTNARAELDRELGSDFSDLNLREMDPRSAVKKYVWDVMDEDDPSATSQNGRGTPGDEPLGVGERPPYDYDAT